MGRLIVSRATAADLLDVRHQVLRAGRPRETASFPGDDHPDTHHWLATLGGRPIGVVSVMPTAEPQAREPARWQLRGMAVASELRGRGLGAALLTEVYRELPEPLWCNARAGAVGFYLRQGWRAVSAPFSIEPIGPHTRMRRDP